MTTERHGAVSFMGDPLTALGDALQPGDTAPDFSLIANNMSNKSLADYEGKVKLISVVPSLDTSVCAAQTKRFNEEAASLSDDIVILTVSADLPFAQARWCGAEGIDKVETLSDHRDMNFGTAYGTHIKEWRMEQRSIIVVDAADKVTYVEYVQEVPDHPDYDAALAAAKEAIK